MRSRVAFVVFLMMCFFRQSSFCDTWPLVLTGQIAPGTGEARFASLSQAAVNSRGDIAFHADLLRPAAGEWGTFPTSGIFLMTGGNLRAVALSGPKQRFMLNYGLSLNNRGDVVFVDHSGVLLFSDGSFKTVATSGQPVP